MDPDHDHEEDDPDLERDDLDLDQHPKDVVSWRYFDGTNRIPLLSLVSSQPSPRVRFGFPTV